MWSIGRCGTYCLRSQIRTVLEDVEYRTVWYLLPEVPDTDSVEYRTVWYLLPEVPDTDGIRGCGV